MRGQPRNRRPALLRDPAAQKRYAAAEEMLAGLAMANPYRVIAAAAPLEKDRAGYTALLETLAELLANPALREMYNLPGRRPPAAGRRSRRFCRCASGTPTCRW